MPASNATARRPPDPPLPPEKRGRSAETRRRIQRAALEIFSRVGFEAAGTRAIAELAGVKQQSIGYHYGTKLGLWKAVADELFAACRVRLEERLAGLDGVDDATVTRLLLREYLLFTAAHPELGRFMLHEGAQAGPRLQWLYERHTRDLLVPLLARLERAQRDGIAPAGNPVHLMYVLLGASAMFAQPAEYAMITGVDVASPSVVDSYVDLVVSLITPGP